MGKSRETSRRSVLSSIGAVALGVSGVGTVVSTGPSNRVTQGEARKVARLKLQRIQSQDLPGYSTWNGATLRKPMKFYAKNPRKGPAYVPSAHLFTVMNRGSDVGYLTISADRRNPAVIEFSNATPPSKHVRKFKSRAKAVGRSPTGRKLYHGGLDYQLELKGEVGVNLQNGIASSVYARSKFAPGKNEVSKGRVKNQWDDISKRGGI